MKNIKYYIACLFTVSMLSSCEDFLDLEPDGQLTTDLVLSTLDGMEGSITGVYNRARFVFEDNNLNMYETAGTDLVMAGTHLGDQAIAQAFSTYNSNLNPDNTGVRDIWNGYYTGLNRANVIIDKIDGLDGVNPNDGAQAARIRQVKGEAFFFRAFFHFQLLKKWENVVLVPGAPETVSLEASLAPPADVVALILADLETAITLLPDAVVSNGKVSSATANHLLMKAYMWDGQSAKAAEAGERVLTNPNYQLEEDLNVIFNTMHEENREILLSWQFDQADAGTFSRTCQQWFPLYDRVVGVARTFEQGGRPWARIAPNDYYWSLFDTDGDGTIDDETDLRLEAWHKRYWFFDSVDEGLPAGVELGDTVTVELMAGVEPRYITPTTTKYIEDGFLGRQIGDAEGYKNVIQYRLAETYLVAAEAHMTSGNMARALELVNTIRRRAGNEDISELDQESYLAEHARELGHEGVRLELLQRLGILYERATLHNPEAGAAMQPYHVRWPIPRSFVQTTGVPQNPGYTN